MRQLGKWGKWVVLLAFFMVVQPSAADVIEGESEVRARLKTLLPYFQDKPAETVKEQFAPSFLQTLDARQVKVVEPFQKLFDSHGRAIEFRILRMTRPYVADVEIVFERDARVPGTMGIEGKAPHRISGMQFHAAIRDKDRVGDVTKEMQKLPGKHGYAVMRLGAQPRVLFEYNGAEPFAVASVMKLVVFATLVDEIAKGKRKWEDVVPVNKEWASLPAGLVQNWADGAPVTLYVLATLMLTQSDNTAADHLLRLLGRERVEAMQRTLGIKKPELNEPFLYTAESFKLKLVSSAADLEAFVAASTAERRQLLDGKVKSTSLLRPRPLAEPKAIDSIEWFFSPEDLCRVLEWLRSHFHVSHVADLLATGQGFFVDEQHWYYVAYKGGMERGVQVYTLLLKDKQDRWYAVAACWNDPKEDVDGVQLLILTQRLLRLAQRL